MTLISSIRNTPRLAELVGALIKFGFDEFVNDTGLGKLISKYIHLKKKPALDERSHGQPIKVRLRLLLEDLGPTYIKLGQILSTRPDLIPEEIAGELKKLQDDCPHLDFEVVSQRLKEELDSPLDELFSSIEEKPLAAGSLAQVHRATLKDGTPVVLKVIRPKASKMIVADMAILTEIAKFVEKHFSEIGYSPTLVVKEISKQITKELDLVNEGKNAERLRTFFSDIEEVNFPKIFWDTTTRNILTMEEVPGSPLSALDMTTLTKEQRHKIVANGADGVYRMCLEFGLFHADPHPGNIFVQPDGKVYFIDCGMVGQIEKDTLKDLAELVAAVLDNNLTKVVRIVIGMTQADPDLESNRDFRESAWDIISRFHVGSLENLDLINLINSLFEVLREFHIRCPADLVYLIKAMATIQGVGQEIDPSFDIVSHVKPLIHQMIFRQFGLLAIKDRLIRGMINYAELLEALPDEFRSIFIQLRQRHFKIRLQLDELIAFKKTVSHSSKLIAMSLIISSIIIGSAGLAKVSGWNIIILIGVTGLIIGCVCCVILLTDIFHDRK